MNFKARIFAIPVIIVAVLAVYYVLSLNSSTLRALEFIDSRETAPGVFRDYDRSICVESADDVGWYYKHDVWYLVFGKISIELKPRQLKEKAVVQALENIGVKFYGNIDEGSLKFYWYDKELQHFASRSSLY